MGDQAVPSKQSLERLSTYGDRAIWVLLAITCISMMSSVILLDSSTDSAMLVMIGVGFFGFCLCYISLSVRDRAQKKLNKLYLNVEHGTIVGFKSVPVQLGYKSYAVIEGNNELEQKTRQDKEIHPDQLRTLNVGDTFPFTK